MDSLTSYNLATEELNAGTTKETEKYYDEAKNHYEKAIEYFLGALTRKCSNVLDGGEFCLL